MPWHPVLSILVGRVLKYTVPHGNLILSGFFIFVALVSFVVKYNHHTNAKPGSGVGSGACMARPRAMMSATAPSILRTLRSLRG